MTQGGNCSTFAGTRRFGYGPFMKITTLPSRSPEELQRIYGPIRSGTLVTIDSGKDKAIAVKIDADQLNDTGSLHAALDKFVAVASNPVTPKATAQAAGLVKDFQSFGTLAIPDHMPAVAGHVVDGFVIVAATAKFWQEIVKAESGVRISVAGAELAAGFAEAFWPSPTTKMVGFLVRGTSKVVAINDLVASAAKPSSPKPGE